MRYCLALTQNRYKHIKYLVSVSLRRSPIFKGYAVRSLSSKLLFILFPFVLAPFSLADSHKEHAIHSRIGYHGMAVFTDGSAIFASHLPLYRQPHDFQIIYRLAFDHKGAEQQIQQYLNENKRSDGQAVMTLLPEQFDLNELATAQTPTLKTRFFTDHFERGGQPMLFNDKKEVSVKYATPVLVEQLIVANSDASKNAARKANWVSVSLPSNPQIAKLFVHKIDTKPSFDAIVIAKGCEEAGAYEGNALSIDAIRDAFAHCDTVEIPYADAQDFQ